jgi:hypothetical protein
MRIINKVKSILERQSELVFFLRYIALFTLLLISLASMALNRIIVSESNPFFYADF